MASRHSVSYLKQITAAQEIVSNQLERVRTLEKNLRNRKIPDDKREEMENELFEIKSEIIQKEKELKVYYGENRKTFMFAVLLMFFSFLFYVVYIMIVGTDKVQKPIRLYPEEF